MSDTGSTERGFGTGLRAKLEGGSGGGPEAPRSPGEAIAAAPLLPDPDVQALRAELSASLAREQELRASLNEQVDAFGREVESAQDAAELDRRAAALSATEAELEDRERQVLERLEEVADTEVRIRELEQEVAKTEARVQEREQLVELKVRELKTADGERATAAAELAEQIASIAEREKELARAEGAASAARDESERKAAKG